MPKAGRHQPPPGQPRLTDSAPLPPAIRAVAKAVAAVAIEQELPHWCRRVPVVAGQTCQLAAIWALLAGPVFNALPNFGMAVSRAFGLVNLPGNPSLFNAATLFLLAGALLHRKRLALWTILWLFQVTQVVYGIGLALAHFRGQDVRHFLPVGVGTIHNRISDQAVADSVAWELASAALGMVICIVLLLAKDSFAARVERGSWWRAVSVALASWIMAAVVGFGLITLFAGSLVGPARRLWWSLSVVLGQSPIEFESTPVSGSWWISRLISFLAALGVVAAFATFLRGGRAHGVMTAAEELRLRSLLARYPADSLGYFSTRRDKSVVFAGDDQAGVAYRLVGSVLLASGDPLGSPDSWGQAIQRFLGVARASGWTPAALALSPVGAAAYQAAGLKSLALGDEAVLVVDDFSLNRPGFEAVRTTVRRARRAGYRVLVQRQDQLDRSQVEAITERAERWRRGGRERGFSMASSRIGDPSDPSTVVVMAVDRDGQLRGLLSFVPWGQAGLSLDYMRHDPQARSGVTELMVAGLVEFARDHGYREISVNFAVARRVLTAGAEIGAFGFERLGRKALLLASRWWQIDSLYQANEKYQPHWRRRLLAYDHGARLTEVLLAVLQAEGWLPWLADRLRTGRPQADSAENAARGPDFAAAVAEVERQALAAGRAAPPRSDQQTDRLRALAALRSLGVEPFPASPGASQSVANLRQQYANSAPDGVTRPLVSVFGRVVGLRCHGGLIFADLRQGQSNLQLLLDRADLDAVAAAAGRLQNFDLWRRQVKLGDLVLVTGELMVTRTGELSLAVTAWELIAKALRPLPQVREQLGPDHGMVRVRAKTLRALRRCLDDRGYLEVETPILQAVHGGARARPFRTHINAYDRDLYLRIAPELELKKLLVGGLERIYEIGRNFRNEGFDSRHNPEFTALEAYCVLGDYTVMRELARDLIMTAATAVHGRPIALRPDGTVVDLTVDWPVLTVHEAVGKALGQVVSPDTALATLRTAALENQVRIRPTMSDGQIVVELYEALVEPKTESPTFYVDFPTETAPLARPHRSDSRLAERWDLVAWGNELGTAYTELTDPIDQRDRLRQQSLEAAAGDPEAMELNESFLTALEYGMPPAGGLGLGVDRLIMALTGTTIRQTLAAPFSRVRSARSDQPD